mgnify:CR=1 FL=1
MADHDFRSPSIEAFLDDLGSSSPAPGGGAGAALTAAMGAALVQMLGELTIGKKKYAAHEELMQAIVEQAKSERDTLLALAETDAAAFDGVSAAFKLPKGTDEEKAARARAIQDAMKKASEVPLEIMHHCLEVISLAKNAVQRGNVNVISDGAAGAELCRAAMRVAGYNVKINLAAIEDTDYVQHARTRMDEMAYMGTAVANEIDSHVNELWQSGS